MIQLTTKIITALMCFLVAKVFSQEIQTDSVTLYNNTIELPGELTYTKGSIQPLVIFVHGSGNVDRNGNQAGANVKANYIKQLADSLNTLGIAFYRYDKRTANPKNRTQNLKQIVFTDLVEDVQVAIKHFKKDKRFNSITLIGHSQGSLTAMLAINKDVDKYISLAGLGETVEETIVRQITAQSQEIGDAAKQHFEELKKTDTIKNTNQYLAGIFNPANYEFLLSYNAHKPTEAIKKVTIPTLILNGDADLQVRVKDAQMLHEAKPDAILEIIPKMNHVLKEINNPTENQQSYYSANFPLSNKLIEVLSNFIKQ
jgi:hypothetical protein